MAITNEQIKEVLTREDLTDEERIKELNRMFAEDKANEYKRDMAEEFRKNSVVSVALDNLDSFLFGAKHACETLNIHNLRLTNNIKFAIKELGTLKKALM
jgi:hypothetical protein